MAKKVLMLVPSINARGGITNYFEAIRPYLPSNYYYLTRGARNWPKRRNILIEGTRIIFDIFKFIQLIIKKDIEIILTSTSLGNYSLKRDAIFIRLAKLFRIDFLVFFRGWNIDYEKYLARDARTKKIFFDAKKILVLSRYSKERLINWGYKGEIFLETTAINKKMVDDIYIEQVKDRIFNVTAFRFLYLARLEKEKGIFETVQMFEILNKEFSNIVLDIVGDGRAEFEIKEYVYKSGNKNINFYGYLSGNKKINIYLRSHIYVFPSYTEGMPTSVLEAMAFGLPVITRAVGGLNDFFVDGVNGFKTNSYDPLDFVKLARKLLIDKKLFTDISLNNFLWARKVFVADNVARRIINVIEN